MIKLYTDISYKNLYGHLLKLLLEKTNPMFAESWIVVPNHSAKQWLQKSLARDLGVCTQIRFIMPLSFNWEIIKNVATQEHKINIFSKDVLRWQIYQLLLNDDKYQHLKQNSTIKNFNLAEKIAQTLLQYNEEHPEVIAKWDGDVYEVSEPYQWQVEMWLQLQDNLPTKSPVELLELFDAQTDFKQQPANILLFATEQLSSLQKATILKLAQKQDIQLFLTNPCPDDYWFDLKPEATKARSRLFNSEVADIIEIGNPLLSSLGFNKMALFDAFLQEDIHMIEAENHYNGTSLFESVKQDIFNLQQQPSKCETDNSIIIHSCHNRKRELEVIKDDILRNLEYDKKLNPEDIIVVAPDINDYVLNIKEVFNPENSQYLPFHIDRVQLADNQYITSMMNLLESFNQEMTATVIYQLLSQTPILQKFSINEGDLPRIRNWIFKSNIRNFYSKQHKSQLGFEAKVGNTWQFGKNRWIAGYLAGDVENIDYLSTFGDISGQEGVFAGCFEFLELWYKYYLKAQNIQSPQKWFELITEICQIFLYNDISDDFEKKILDPLENKFITQTLESQPEIGLVVVTAIVGAVITENNFRSEGQIGIRFQSWENAFLVEAKLVIILGLNDGEFPKNQIKNDLDMFSKTPARLNKSTRQRDKNLMLTVLTENIDKIIMTYIGFDAKTNEPQPPSVILAEIMSYLQQKTDQQFTIHEHKMHGYHKNYFSEKYFNYNHNHYQLAQSFYHKKIETIQPELNLNKVALSQISLNDLMKFFTDPLETYLKNNAQINNTIFEDVLLDTETYFPSGLEAWKLKQEIFINGKSTACKTGIVSDNKSGQTLLNQFDNDLKTLFELKKGMSLEPHGIECVVADTKIMGKIDTDEKQSLISFYPGKATTKNLCKHWIKHLCYQSNQSSFVHFEDKDFEFSPLENNNELLHAIVVKWQQSFNNPWLFCPPAFLNILARKIDIHKKNIYIKKFAVDDRNFPSEGQKYFINEVEKYNEEYDLEEFLQPLIDGVETI